MSTMISFENDYAEGAHPAVLQHFIHTNLIQQPGYGNDCWCESAAEKIRLACNAPEADVHFIVGGTQTNAVVIGTMLAPYEGVIAAETGHINVHEAGAIEGTSHKVCAVPSSSSKLTPDMIRSVCSEHSTEMMVHPKIVYISNATEMGAIYTKAELAALRECCDALGLYLYLDGARLGSALAASNGDLTLEDAAALTDAFTIGGTKNGALLGEAIVLMNPALQAQFRWHMKQRGAILAKGRLLGIQFLELLKDDLYFQLAAHANAMADRLRQGILELGYEIPIPSSSNLFFPIFPNTVIRQLEENYAFEIDHTIDRDNTLIRLVTSWTTPAHAVENFLADLAKCR